MITLDSVELVSEWVEVFTVIKNVLAILEVTI